MTNALNIYTPQQCLPAVLGITACGGLSELEGVAVYTEGDNTDTHTTHECTCTHLCMHMRIQTFTHFFLDLTVELEVQVLSTKSNCQ